MSGIRLAIAYGLKPYEMGLCGGEKKDVAVLESCLYNSSQEHKAIRILMGFKNAFPFYCLIAKSNGIKDPFDERVVEAYWVGNELLENVKRGDLLDVATEILLDKLPPAQVRKLVAKIPKGVFAHHSFVVLLTSKSVKKAEICLVGCGVVRTLDIEGDKVHCVSMMKWKGGAFKREEKIISWNKSIVSFMKGYDIISFHFNQVCQVLSKKQALNLAHYTASNLKAFKRR